VSRSASKGLPWPPAPSAESPALLRTSKLVKVYRADGVTVEAVRGVDIELAIGEFVAIMGPSGSGKSTLLHVLGGLEPATSGEIWLRGQRVDRLSRAAWAVLRRQHIGFVFQFFNLLSNMTVADNVELPALLAGATPRQARKRREELLAELGIAEKAGAAPARLSGGEQQRIALARALANEPSLLLADEPTGNLDSSNTRDVLRLLGTELDGPAIARELMVSLNTVRTHTKNIYTKLAVTNRRAAVRRAAELDLPRTRNR